MKLNVAVQMDPIARINIRGDSTFALLLEAQKRGHACPITPRTSSRCAARKLVAPVQLLTVRDEVGDHFTLGEPRRDAAHRLRRRAAAPGPAVRPRLHHLDASARAHPPQDAGGERSRQRAQRAGKNLRDGFSGVDAADADFARPRRDQRLPRRARRRGDEAAARPWRRRGVSRHAAGHEFRLAVRHVLGDVQGALGDPALPSRGQARRQAHHPGRRRIRRRRQPRAGGRRSALQHGARRCRAGHRPLPARARNLRDARAQSCASAACCSSASTSSTASSPRSTSPRRPASAPSRGSTGRMSRQKSGT